MLALHDALPIFPLPSALSHGGRHDADRERATEGRGAMIRLAAALTASASLLVNQPALAQDHSRHQGMSMPGMQMPTPPKPAAKKAVAKKTGEKKIGKATCRERVCQYV